MELLVYLLLYRRVCNIINAHDFMAEHTLIRASARFLRGNFSRKFWGWRGQKFLRKKKTFPTRKLSGKISSPKISSGNFGSDSPSGGNFEAQKFLETRANFTRKFWDHLIIELKSVPFPSTG